MGLREGYKQTEVGVIPEDWSSKPIGKACKLINGRGFKPYEWKSEGLPIIRIQNLNGSVDFNYFQGSYDKKIEVDDGQLLFAWSGSRGTSFGPHIWNGSLGLLNYHTWKIVVNKKEVDSSYFLHALKKLTKFIEEKAHGASALVHTQKWEMEGFEFPIPPTKTEQTAIANALSDADALIQSLTRLIAKKRQIKQGAMQTLLNPYEDGRLKVGWVAKKLGDVVIKFIGGGTPSRSIKEYWGKDYLWVTVKDFATFNPHTAQESITINGLKNSATHLIPKGTIITSTRMALGKAVVYEVEVCINQDLKAVFPINEIIVKYMLYWFEYNEEKIADLGSGSTVMGLSLDELKKIDFPNPPVIEQSRIANILSEMDANIAALETKLAKTQKIKQGMMQNLLTGKIRLI